MNKTDITVVPVFEGEKTSRQAFLDLIIYELKNNSNIADRELREPYNKCIGGSCGLAETKKG